MPKSKKSSGFAYRVRAGASTEALKERILSIDLMNLLTARDDYISEVPEISSEHLEALQRDIDSKLKPGIKFKSVSRASW